MSNYYNKKRNKNQKSNNNITIKMEKDSSDISSISNEDNINGKNKDLNIKTLNPEQDLLLFLKEMNFKQSSIDIKYPKVIYIIYIIHHIFIIYSISSKF